MQANSDYSISSSSATSNDGDDTTFSASAHERPSADTSPIMMSPWIYNQLSPLSKFLPPPPNAPLIGLRRTEGHVYSVAAKGGLLYTGSDGKNIRVWKDMQEFDSFKSSSGFVKAIVVCGDTIYTGHQDGRIRRWRLDGKKIGTMPTFFDVLKASVTPSKYVKVTRRRRRSALWIKHCDAVSCLSMDEESGLLYSGSWDTTVKVWEIGTLKCVESVAAHDDAVNAVVAGGYGLVYTGSADGTVRVWRREQDGGAVSRRHFLWRTLLCQDFAVTALAVAARGSVVYCGSSDGVVNFWEVEKGMELSHGGVLRGHRQAVLCLAAAGNLLLSGSADNTICVWRRRGVEHTRLTVLSGHTGPVKCLTVEADGDRKWKVYSGSLDNSVKLWSVSEIKG